MNTLTKYQCLKCEHKFIEPLLYTRSDTVDVYRCPKCGSSRFKKVVDDE